MDKKLKVIISGGGTGGHIFPAISIANALKEAVANIEILFVGANGRMEMEKVPAAGYEIVGLPIQGFQRSLSLKNIKVLFNAIKSVFLSKKIIQDFKPDIVIGVGGYASGPVLYKANKMGIPTLIQEQNSYAGITNKILSKQCSKICVAYDNMDRFFAEDKIVLTGNPIRQELLHKNFSKKEAYKFFGFNEKKKTLLIIGGSLGARTINNSILKGLRQLGEMNENEIQVIWQTGKFYIENIKKEIANFNLKNFYISDFIYKMDYAYEIADLVISRAGASSISELSLLKKACILVPSPNVSEDHQTKNAMALVNNGAAVIIPDANAEELLVQKSISLIKDKVQLNKLSRNIVGFARPDAANSITQEILKLVDIDFQFTPYELKSTINSNDNIDNTKSANEVLRNYYFIGIGGIGMSAIARYFHKQGCLVAGYDKTETELTKSLQAEGIEIHYEDNISRIPLKFMDTALTTVIYTPAIPKDMSELVFFQKAEFKILKRSEVLGELTLNKKALCVAGTHGKTTTSTILAHILKNTKQGVNAFLGGISKNYDSNLIVSQNSDLVVVEADEYDRSFLRLKPNMAIITACDADHLDIYNSKEQLLDSFSEFTSLIENNGYLVVRKGLEFNIKVKDLVKVFTYSSTEQADFYADNIKVENGEIYFDFVSQQITIENIKLGVPFYINIENTVAAIAIALLNNIDSETIKNAIASFAGIKRRFDFQIKNDNLIFIDDYAHHPAEINASINSVRQLYKDKKICGIFQPHLYSRTRDFAKEFAESLSQLDEIILLDIYPARELPIKGVKSDIIYKQIKNKNKFKYQKEELLSKLNKHKFDILLTIGAGDIDKLVPQIKEQLLGTQAN